MTATHRVILVFSFAIASFAASQSQTQEAGALPWIKISPDGRSFVLQPGSNAFLPRGFNYDHDEAGRLIEDYWQDEWKKIEDDFAEMKALGANVVRVHLQLGKFMETAKDSNEQSLDRLAKLVQLAEQTGLYLDLTGLGCYHKQDVPTWYDKLSEADRWQVQALFWKSVASKCANSPAIFCYDLMNEPVSPAGDDHQNWLGPAFAGSHFVQMIGLKNRGRSRPAIAREWIKTLVAAIRSVDKRHLITVGLVDWSLDRPGLTSGFVPKEIASELDFLCVHLYPHAGKVAEAIETLDGFAVGKPLVVEETFPLACSRGEFEEFIEKSKPIAAGWIMFYWGTPAEQLRKSSKIEDALLLQSLEIFERQVKLHGAE